MQNGCGRLVSEAPDSAAHWELNLKPWRLRCLALPVDRSWTPRWLCEITPTVLWSEPRFIFISFTLTMSWKEKPGDSWESSWLQCLARDFSKDRRVFLVLSTCFSCLSSVVFTWDYITKRLRMSTSPDFNCCRFVILCFPSWELSHLSTYYPESIVHCLLCLLLSVHVHPVWIALALKDGGLICESLWKSFKFILKVLPLPGWRLGLLV